MPQQHQQAPRRQDMETARRIIDRHVIMHGVGMPPDDVPAGRMAMARDIADALQGARERRCRDELRKLSGAASCFRSTSGNGGDPHERRCGRTQLHGGRVPISLHSSIDTILTAPQPLDFVSQWSHSSALTPHCAV
jgi:hypothetical protein